MDSSQYTSRYNLHHTHIHTHTHKHTHTHTPHSKSNNVIYRKRWREYLDLASWFSNIWHSTKAVAFNGIPQGSLEFTMTQTFIFSDAQSFPEPDALNCKPVHHLYTHDLTQAHWNKFSSTPCNFGQYIGCKDEEKKIITKTQCKKIITMTGRSCLHCFL